MKEKKFGIALLVLGLIVASFALVDIKDGFNAANAYAAPLGGNTLYVGGSGPNNYTKIQDAIDNSSNGDKVFVYSGTYYENITIYKTIDLIGEDRGRTIIDGMKKGEVLKISGDGITVSNFTIKNSSKWPSTAIYLSSDSMNNTFVGNIITSNGQAILMDGACNNIISQNIIIENTCGIGCAKSSNNNVISHNYISTGGCGIGIGGSCRGNKISFNMLYKNYNGICIYGINNRVYKNEITFCEEIGIAIWDGVGNVITYNNISHNSYGIKLGSFDLKKFYELCLLNSIIKNNFMNNFQHAQIGFNILPKPNIWMGNYWDDWKLPIPKPISGYVLFGYAGYMSWIQFDWHPALKPYEW